MRNNIKNNISKIKLNFNKSYKNIEWSLFFIILLSLILPFIYKFLKIFFISFSGIDSLAAYQSESSYANLLYETLGIFVIVPIYAFVNKNTTNSIEKKEKFIISLTISIISAFVLWMLIFVTGIPLSVFLIGNGNGEILIFFILGLGFSIMLINSVIIAFLILKKNKKYLLITTLLILILHIGTDFILISGVIFDLNILTLGLSIIFAPLINLLILIWITFFINKKERKEWKISFKNFSFIKWKKDLNVYKKTGLFSGGETLYWNLMWFLGIMLPFLIMGKDNSAIISGGLLADSLFWVVLVIPLNAATYLQAENHSHDSTRSEHNQKITQGFIVATVIAISWLIIGPIIIEYLYPILLKNTNSEEAIYYAQSLSWIMFFFYFFMLITRIIYSYWVTTNQAFKNFASTFISTTICWLPSFLIFIINPDLITSPWIVATIYGVGLFFISAISVIQLILENTKIKLPNWYINLAFLEEPIKIKNNYELLQRKIWSSDFEYFMNNFDEFLEWYKWT